MAQGTTSSFDHIKDWLFLRISGWRWIMHFNLYIPSLSLIANTPCASDWRHTCFTHCTTIAHAHVFQLGAKTIPQCYSMQYHRSFRWMWSQAWINRRKPYLRECCTAEATSRNTKQSKRAGIIWGDTCTSDKCLDGRAVGEKEKSEGRRLRVLYFKQRMEMERQMSIIR